MNVLGVGGIELLIVLVIMLVVAGPKRMIHWSYILGRYLAKFRRMWSETVDIVQKEFDEAGVGVQLPRQVPTRGSLNKQAGKMLSGVTAPVQETLDEVNAGLGDIRATTRDTAKSANAVATGSNGGQAVLKTGPAPKPARAQPAPAKAAAPSATTTSVRSTSPARRAAPQRADDDFGAWSGHGAAQVGAWARDGSPVKAEEEA